MKCKKTKQFTIPPTYQHVRVSILSDWDGIFQRWQFITNEIWLEWTTSTHPTRCKSCCHSHSYSFPWCIWILIAWCAFVMHHASHTIYKHAFWSWCFHILTYILTLEWGRRWILRVRNCWLYYYYRIFMRPFLYYRLKHVVIGFSNLQSFTMKPI